MARIYVCDRCKAQSSTWTTTPVELPAMSFFGKKTDVELCGACLQELRKIFNMYMEGAFHDTKTAR